MGDLASSQLGDVPVVRGRQHAVVHAGEGGHDGGGLGVQCGETSGMLPLKGVTFKLAP